ncbi:MAG TPA: hypothetical protein VIH35_00945 [Kiritimatiellia bacterium]
MSRVLFVISMLAAAARAETVRFDLSAVAEKDVIYERGLASSAEPAGENPKGTQAFVEQGMMDADGLPAAGKISSPAGFGDYALLSYKGKNAIELPSHADAPAESHAVDVPDAKYSRIGVLGAAVDGDCSFTIKLVYLDGSETVGWWETEDWYQPQLNRGNCVPAAANMDRMNTETRELDDANHYQLYEFIVADVDPAKTLAQIVIGNDPHRFDASKESWGLVFAINGEMAPGQ